MPQEDVNKAKKRIDRVLDKYSDNENLQDFNNYLTLTLKTTGNEHHFRTLNNVKIMMRENPEMNWEDLQEKDVEKLLVQIERSEYNPRDEDYSWKTKNKYRGALKKYLQHQDKEWGEMAPKGISTYKQGDKNFTPRGKTPNPEELKKFLGEVEIKSSDRTRLRNLAFFFTLYDTGARTSGLVTSKKSEVEVKEKTVKVQIEPTKRSPKRKPECFYSAIVLKKYLENHPKPESEYLFPHLEDKGGTDRDEGYVNPDTLRNMANQIWKELTESDIVDVKYKQQPLHVFRKGMKTWYNNMNIINEADIDLRVGHVIGSKQTRAYTRKQNSDSNRNMRKTFGIEDDEDKDWKRVLWPKKCSCGELNSGHRNSCRSCGSVLNELAYPKDVEVIEKDPMEELIQEEDVDMEDLKNAVEKLKDAGLI